MPELTVFLPIAGLTALLNGFNSIAILTSERRLAQGRLILLQLGSYLVSTSVVLAWLLLVDLSVWALLVGRLVGSSLETLGSYWLLDGPRCRLTWDRAVASEIFQFGKWVLVSTACTFLAEQADRLIVGKVASLTTLGVYNLAVQLALAARQVVNTITGRVVFPFYSRRYQQGASLLEIFHQVHPWVAGFAAFLTAGLISAGPAFIRCLFRPEYKSAGWMLQLLAVGGWITMLEMISGCLLWVHGNARTPALGMALKLLALPLCAWGGYWLAGLGGMILGLAAAELLRYGVVLWALRSQGLPILRYDLCLSAAIVLTCLAAGQTGGLFAWSGEPPPDGGGAFGGVSPGWAQLLAEVLTVVVLWMGLAVAGRSWRRLELPRPLVA